MKTNKMRTRKNILYSAVGSAVFCLKRSPSGFRSRSFIFFMASLFLLSLLLPLVQAGSDIKAAPEAKDAQAAKTAGIQELLATIGKKVSNFRSLKTDFVQEKDLAMFKKKIILRGRIYMEKPNRLVGYLLVIFSSSDFYQNDLGHENLAFVFHRNLLQFLRPA